MARILIVEDDVHHARVLTNLMHYAKYEVETASNGLQALDMIASQPPDLILLDIMMPVLDGFEVLKRLRADPATASIPVIVVTAKGNGRDIEKGLDLGASDYMVKPIMLESLLARVRTLLRLKEAQDRLQAANEELQRVSDVKGRLVAVVSHELRTPLTSIRGALDLVGRANPDLPARSKQLLEISMRNTDRLIRLVNGVLTFARVETGLELELRETSLDEIILRAIEEVGTLTEQKEIRAEATTQPDLPTLKVDPDRIHQVLINLLSNAVKVTEPGGKVQILARRESKGVRVEVSDTGCGIPEAELPKLFKPFSQIQNKHQPQVGGTGLGLAISREIIERHKGKVGVESVVGQGSTFWFWLPLPAPAPQE